MTKVTSPIPTDLEPCRACGAPCRVERFEGDAIEGVMTVYFCANSTKFGGDCPDPHAYLNVNAWNTRAATGVEHLQSQLTSMIAERDNPVVADFMRGVPLEAEHQRARWGADHDAGKSPFDWFWLIGYLSQKAASAAVDGDTEKALHHTISTAAALANWHLALSGTDTRMRPGIDPVRVQTGGSEPSGPRNDPERKQAA